MRFRLPGFLTRTAPAAAAPAGATERLAVDVGGEAVAVVLRRNPRARRYTLRLSPDRSGAVLTLPAGGSLRTARAFLDRHRGWLAEHLARRPQAVAFADGAVIPIRGMPHRLCAVPGLRGTVRVRPLVAGAAPGSGPEFGPGAGPGCGGDAGSSADPGRRYDADADGAVAELLVPGDPAAFSRRVGDHLKALARADLLAAVERHAAALGRRPARVVLRDTTSRWGSCSSRGTLSFSWRLVLAPPFVLDYLAAHEVAHLAEMNHGPVFWDHCRRLCPRSDEARAWLKANGAGLHAIG